jgi:hypothetical protein
MTREETMAYITTPRTTSLATIGADGFPHVAAMWYGFVDDHVVMATYAKSQKAVNLLRDSRCALHWESGEIYDELRGVLVQAKAVLVDDPSTVFDYMCAVYDTFRLPRFGPMPSEMHTRYVAQSHKRIGVAVPLERISSWDHRKISQ